MPCFLHLGLKMASRIDHVAVVDEMETAVLNQKEGEAEMEENLEMEKEKIEQDFCLEILPLIKDSQNQHGLRHGDYWSYRLYCSRRLRRIRKSLHFTHGRKHRYTAKLLTVEMIKDIRYLHLPLICAERAWAHAMQLKQDADKNFRKKHHLNRKLSKANKYAQELLSLCELCPRCDPRTRLEAEAYAKWMQANLYFEKQEWKRAFDCFGSAQTIYEQLASAVLEEHRCHYSQRVDEIVPSIRYCAYNIGDMPSDIKQLSQLRVAAPGYELLASKIDLVISQTRAKAASTLTEITWCGRKVPVKNDKLRISLVHLRELCDEAQRKVEEESASQQLCEQIVLECHDTLQIIKEDLQQEKKEEEKSHKKSQRLETLRNHLADIQNYVTHMKLTHSIKRTLLIVASLQKSQKKGRPDEFVRLFDSLLQHLNELENLPGFSEDLEEQKQLTARSFRFKSHRAFYLAESYAESEKWAEAYALYDRAMEHLSQAIKLYGSNKSALADLQKLSDQVRGQRSVAQVSLFGGKDKEKTENVDLSTPLASRLDEVLRISPNKKLPPLAPLPPELQPIPCKPLFFDLAKKHIEFPNLDHRIEEKSKGASGGLLGWLWGGKK